MVEQLLQYHQQPETLLDMSQEDLVQLVRSASAVLSQRTERVEVLAAANKRLKRQATQLEKDIAAVKDATQTATTSQAIKRIKHLSSTKSTLELKTRGQAHKRLTADSVLAVGLRRNFSNIASCDFGSTILFPLSHQTVTRCESRAACALKAAFSAFVLEKLHVCRLFSEALRESNVPTRSYTLMTVAIRSDATNSNIWRRHKLHLCECTIGFNCFIDEALSSTTGIRTMQMQRKRLLNLAWKGKEGAWV